MNYGERLKKARKLRKWSQEDLVRESQVPQGTISKIERGDQLTSTYDSVLADTLGISAIWLTKEKGEMFESIKLYDLREPGIAETSTDEAEILRLYRLLNEYQKHYIRVSLKGLVNAMRHKAND